MKKSEKAKKKINHKRNFVCFITGFSVFVLILVSLNSWVITDLKSIADSYQMVEASQRLVPEKDGDGNWVFITDGDFKVLHLTDIHIGGGFLSKSVDEKALNAVAAMVTKEQPDLVIATGDIAYPVPYQAGTFNNKTGAQVFGELMENLGVYWAVTLGNHDSEVYNYYSREAVASFYENADYKYCLFQRGPEDIKGYGNYIIKVKNTEGFITQAFVLLDSHSYTNGDYFGIRWQYDNIHQNQIDWYKEQISLMNTENQETLKSLDTDATAVDFTTVKSLAFFHIPLAEMKEGWDSFIANGFENTEDFTYTSGIIGETGKRVYCGIYEDELFEAMQELGSTKAVFNGHDHYNNVTFSYKDIIFSYGYSIDYLAYFGIKNEGSQRGCTLITVKPDTTFTIEKFNYYSDRYNLQGFDKEEVRMQFGNVEYQMNE